ncbi:type II toxin-antitoxin system PemK/MazF family toxin [Peptoniphilus sp. MSJ-1]|uniref:mRNA interferase n=1 Tax=Peptoniphilus ovalis TaxID=2841503 RepID=A0ABS6FJD7_9FIRM|nr:type II toxin-antitoxin system PemK/MazF family toxin [Peptoniphilus ovalis]MBU5669617.1 type II toxin-antitoxin system PemK/MazF family toxin [Peptoniphilus ovalis]
MSQTNEFDLKLKRGDVVMVDLGERFGYEQDGIRPAVIIQNNIGNEYSPTVIIAPITAGKKNNIDLPTHVIGIELRKKSIALLEQILTIDRRRIISFIASLDVETMKDIDEKIKVSLGL